jgi:GNAT superfamily N-acetyltransferase
MPDNPNLGFALRAAANDDRPFLVEMARQVCTLEGQPPAAADDPHVAAFLPDSLDATIVAVDGSKRRVGAIWWVWREPPLLRDPEGSPLPELAVAVVEDQRGKGIGQALVEALVARARGHFPALALNVHLLNPAVRLYVRAGFKVAAAGRGWYGVAMSMPLDS